MIKFDIRYWQTWKLTGILELSCEVGFQNPVQFVAQHVNHLCGSNKLLQKGVEAWEPRCGSTGLVTSNLFRFHLWHLSCWKYGNGHSESIQAFREVLCVCCRHHNNSPSLISGSSCRILRRRRGDDSGESRWRRRRRNNRCKPQKNVRLRTDGRRERSIIKPHLRSSVTANQGAFDSSSPSIHSQFCLTPHCFAGAAEGSIHEP